MKATELRIGNWVYTCRPNSGMLAQVQGITIFEEIEFCHSQFIEGFKMPMKHIMGTPITEEWLLSFGFEKKIETTHSLGYAKDYPVYSLSGFTYNGIQAAWWYKGLLEKQPEYVHQLQNLYFALTGQELTKK